MNVKTNTFLMVIFYSVETLLKKMKGVCALSHNYVGVLTHYRPLMPVGMQGDYLAVGKDTWKCLFLC